jgi:uncharacterized protein YjaG (DUF416 family)
VWSDKVKFRQLREHVYQLHQRIARSPEEETLDESQASVQSVRTLDESQASVQSVRTLDESVTFI